MPAPQLAGILRWAGECIFLLLLSITCLFALLLTGIGLWEIARGALHFFDNGHTPIVPTLEGFELLLLAPLPPVITTAVTRYMLVVIWPSDRDADGKRSDAVEEDLHRVKALIASLMMSVIATDLLRRFLESDAGGPAPFLSGAALLLMLGLYSRFLLGRLAFLEG